MSAARPPDSIWPAQPTPYTDCRIFTRKEISSVCAPILSRFHFRCPLNFRPHVDDGYDAPLSIVYGHRAEPALNNLVQAGHNNTLLATEPPQWEIPAFYQIRLSIQQRIWLNATSLLTKSILTGRK
jgi:hypothetical protein